MAIGIKLFAKSFILLRNGQKLYLSNSLESLRRQIETKDQIEVTTSNLKPKRFIIKSSNIELFGNI